MSHNYECNTINAHGGCILLHQGYYYWYGEHKVSGRKGNRAYAGVHLYRSKDLEQWDDLGLAFDIRGGREPEVQEGCILERPKVVYVPMTRKFVLYFHYEAGNGSYLTAAVGIAIADTPEGPFMFHKIMRPCKGFWAQNTPCELRDPERITWTRENYDRIGFGENEMTRECSILGAHVETGQDSRDMTLFSDNGVFYLVHSSEKNSTIHISELSDDALTTTGRYWRIFADYWMEAPCLFRENGVYYFIGSGCTGWAPNAARSASATKLFGPWELLGNPAMGADNDTTFGAQSAHVFRAADGKFRILLDIWRPENAIDGRYLLLPLDVNDGRPTFTMTEFAAVCK